MKVAVIWWLSSTPLIGTVFEPFKSNVYFLGEAYESGVWSRLNTSFSGISLTETNFEIAQWHVILPLLEIWEKVRLCQLSLFLFAQLIPFKPLQPQPTVSSRLPPNPLMILSSLALATPVPTATTIFREITVAARRDPMIIYLTFFNISLSTRLGLLLVVLVIAWLRVQVTINLTSGN